MPVEHMIRLRKVNFINSLVNSKNSTVQAVCAHAAMQELTPIAEHYQVDLAILGCHFKSIINKKWTDSVTNL
jgi:coenzyme F420-reducing hydrogenase gamma subunit